MSTAQPQLYKSINSILEDLTEQSRVLSDRLKLFQAVGIALIVVYFILFVFYFLRKMRHADIALASAHQETREILDNVSDGFFLLDQDSHISSQYSRATENILMRSDFAGQNFFDVVSAIFPVEKIRDSIKLYIEQLHNPRIIEKLIQKLNPLRKVSAQLSNDGSEGDLKTLSFNFSRVVESGSIQKILVNVRDITEITRLEQQLEAEREQSNELAESVTQLVQTDHSLMQQFLQHTLDVLTNINFILKQPQNNPEELREKARLIAREIHSIKGESSALKLSGITHRAQVFESLAKLLTDKEILSGTDFLGLTIKLEDLLSHVQHIREWYDQIRGNTTAGNVSTTTSGSDLSLFFSGFVHEIAQRNHKQANLFTFGLDKVPQDKESFVALKEIMIQLLRNAVVHGIENGVQRQQSGKDVGGMILCGFEQHDRSARLLIQDDGRGLDFDAIRKKAVAKGLATSAQVEAWDKIQCLKVIFHPGFSTAPTNTEDAGRGVGMDIVKANIDKLNGRLSIRTRSAQLTRFTIDFPEFFGE